MCDVRVKSLAPFCVIAAFLLTHVAGAQTRKLVLETGAMDDAAPGFVNLVGFYAARYGTGGMTEVWRQHFENVLANMATSTLGASRGTDPPYDLSLTAGKWDWNKQYIMTHVCGAVPAPAGLCP